MIKRSAHLWRRMAFGLGVPAIAFASGHFVQSTAQWPSDVAVEFAQVVEAPSEDIGAPLTLTCNRDASAEAGIAGMLRIVLSDTCAGGFRISVAQGPLVADWLLDENGQRHLSFTPLEHDSPVIVTWSDGTTTELDAPEIAGEPPFRAALAWQGPQLLSLVAQELRPEFSRTVQDLPTHSATGTTISPTTGGFLTTLGDGIGRTAQVYTFPAGIEGRGVVRMNVVSPVTPRSCARRATAVAFQSDPFGGLMKSHVDIALPECDAIGQTLILRNLFRDLRLAAR